MNFTEKLNVRYDKKPYVIEEEVIIANGKYENYLKHDNVDKNTVNVYTSSKLTGEKINTFSLSIDDDLPWRVWIQINTNYEKVYVSYETIGDTVEAEDINELQSAIVIVNDDLQGYKKENNLQVTKLRGDVDSIEIRKAEKTDVDEQLDKRYLKSEVYNTEEIDTKINKIMLENKVDWNSLQNKPELYTKQELKNIISIPYTWLKLKNGL